MLSGPPVPDSTWTSALYDENWTPGTTATFESDMLIQDFSYAGYNKNELLIPSRDDAPIFNVISYGADTNGVIDSTLAIQSAIDAASEMSGGAVVYLPEGTYRVGPVEGRSRCLLIAKSNVVLRGAGVGKTRLLNASIDMRGKSIILVTPPASVSWSNESAATFLTQDLMSPTVNIPVEDVSGFAVGDEVIIRCDPTVQWITDHNEPDWLGYESELGSFFYCRTLTAVDPAAGVLTVDVPTRYTLKQAYDARVYKKTGMLRGVGIEELSIGNIENPGLSGWGTMDFDDNSASAYSSHYSFAVALINTADSWIQNVESFQYALNQTGAHLLSNGIRLKECRNVSVMNCSLQRPQYGGGGGNGYMFRVDNSNECLLDSCSAAWSRHGFSISGMASSGNVLYRCFDKETGHQTGSTGDEETSGKGSDHHMWFSHSNLYDGCISENSWFEARDRYYPDTSEPKHNTSSAHTVIWNTECLSNSYCSFAVWSMQAKYGYVIGTKGAVSAVRTDGAYPERTSISDPVDYVEGVGEGDTLSPASLYLDQRFKRIGR